MTTIEILPELFEPAGLFFREINKSGTGDGPESDAFDDITVEGAKALLCSRCRTVITSSQHAASINNSHLHTFFNPAGLVYEISCFKQARGCAPNGQPTSEFSWFGGYTWQFAVCLTCQAHLGWFFNSSDNSFYGLITSKLIEE